jgi:hypothetical protein
MKQDNSQFTTLPAAKEDLIRYNQQVLEEFLKHLAAEVQVGQILIIINISPNNINVNNQAVLINFICNIGHIHCYIENLGHNNFGRIGCSHIAATAVIAAIATTMVATPLVTLHTTIRDTIATLNNNYMEVSLNKAADCSLTDDGFVLQYNY